MMIRWLVLKVVRAIDGSGVGGKYIQDQSILMTEFRNLMKNVGARENLLIVISQDLVCCFSSSFDS